MLSILLRYTDSDYPLGIVKLFLLKKVDGIVVLMVFKGVTFIVTIYSAIVNIDSSSLNHKYMYLRFGDIFQQYVSHVVVFSLIGARIRSTRRKKTTCLSQVIDKLYHNLYRVHLLSGFDLTT